MMIRSTMAHIAGFALFGLISAAGALAQPATEKIWMGPETNRDALHDDQSDTTQALKTVSNGLVLTGNVSYNRVGSVVTLSADAIQNNSTFRTTGTLRLELWATTTRPGRAAGFTGYRLAVSPTFSPLSPQTQYSNVVQTTTFTEPPAGTYWIVLVLGEHDSVNCSGNESYCNQDSVVFSNQQTFGSTPTPPQLGLSSKSFGSRGTVSSSARLYGAFELATSGTVYILVRGNSLGTLGVTQAYLDSPRVQLFNAQGADLVSQGGYAGFNDCLASNATTDYPVVYYYAQVRGQPVDPRDSCYTTTLAAGVYTFSVNPSIPGVTTASTSSFPSAGEVLFEVTLVK